MRPRYVRRSRLGWLGPAAVLIGGLVVVWAILGVLARLVALVLRGAVFAAAIAAALAFLGAHAAADRWRHRSRIRHPSHPGLRLIAGYADNNRNVVEQSATTAQEAPTMLDLTRQARTAVDQPTVTTANRLAAVTYLMDELAGAGDLETVTAFVDAAAACIITGDRNAARIILLFVLEDEAAADRILAALDQ